MPRPIALPSPPPRFSGRKHELAELRDALKRHPAVLVSGPPAAGKTSLALHFALEHGSDFKATAFVALRPGDTVERMAAQALVALRPSGVVEQRRDAAASLRALAAVLAEAPSLLLVDDAHYLAARDWALAAAHLFGAAGHSRLVLTARGVPAGLKLPTVELGAPEVPFRGAEALGLLSDRERALVEHLALLGPVALPADVGMPPGTVTRLRSLGVLEREGAPAVLHETTREAVREALGPRVDERLREAVAGLARPLDARTGAMVVRAGIELADDEAAVEGTWALAHARGFLNVGRSGIPGVADLRALDATPRARALLATFELMATAGGTPEWIAALPVSPPAASPEEDLLALVLGYGEKAADADRRLDGVAGLASGGMAALIRAMYLAQQQDPRAADAIARCAEAAKQEKGAYAGDLLTRLAWAESFVDRARSAATLQRALPFVRKFGDLAARLDAVTDLALALLSSNELRAARTLLARELPKAGEVLVEDAYALAWLLHASTLAASGTVPDDLEALEALFDNALLSPLVRFHAAGRVAALHWLAGDFTRADHLLDRALKLDVDARATAALAVVDTLVLMGRLSEASALVSRITYTRDSFRAVREAQLAFYAGDAARTEESLARATRTFATTRAIVESLLGRELLRAGEAEAAGKLGAELLAWAAAEGAEPAALEAHALLAAAGHDRRRHLGAVEAFAAKQGGLAEKAQAFLAVLDGRGDEPWLTALAGGTPARSGPRLALSLDALALKGQSAERRLALVDGLRQDLSTLQLPERQVRFDLRAGELVVGGEDVRLVAQPRLQRALAVLAENSPEWVTTQALFERVFEMPYKATRANALHAVLKRLRKLLGPAAGALESERGRYRLALAGWLVLL